MDAAEAVTLAKQYASEIFAADGLIDARLEEIELDEARDTWNVTIGLLRPLRNAGISGISAQLAALRGEQTPGSRIYRVIRIRNTDGHVLSLKMREEVS